MHNIIHSNNRSLEVTYLIKFNENAGFIVITIEGDFSMSILKELASEVAEEVKTTGCTKILNDMLKANLTASVAEIYNMPREALKSGVKRSIKRALVVPENHKDFHFLEVVFQNQGNIVKIFHTIDEAEKWLNE